MNDLMSIPQVQNLTEDELQVVLNVLKTTKDTGDLSALESLWYCDYDEIPVTIDEFLENDYYMGKVFNNGKLIYPFWRRELHKIFHENPDKAFEICLTGSIGQGKSTISAIALMYVLYRTLCLKDPQKFYGLTQNSPIVFVCLNLTLDLAYAGLYSMIVEAIRMSPWFCERVDIRGKYEYTIEFPHNIGIICASQTTHTIGKNVLFAIMDEMNFSNAPKGSKNSVLDMYRNIRRRLESRFLKQGRIPGFIFLVSSKNSDLDFLDQYIQSIKGNKSTYVIDKAIYEVKPPETYTGEKFKVAVGDKTKQSRILSDDEDEQYAIRMGYRVIEVPVEYRVAFEQDINDALKDIAGISSAATNKLIPYAGRIDKIFDRSRHSPFAVDEIILGLESPEDIRDFIDDFALLKKDIHLPRFIHVDIGLKGDRLGFAMVHSDNQTSVQRYTKEGKIESLIENTYTTDLVFGIKAQAGSEIPLFKVREFIIWLATTVGMKIQQVSYDGFQSADSIQLLKVAGVNAVLQSLDRTADPYLNLRAAILEERISSYYHPILEAELYDLEYDKKNNKVDHTIEGSKDISDGLCGAVYGAQQYYANMKQTKVIQHENVKAALNYIDMMNKKSALGITDEDDYSWL